MADPVILARARELRRSPTGAEALLRRALLDAGERRIRRQFPVGRMIIDLALPSRNLLIEVDGGCHAGMWERDQRRDAWLRGLGFNACRVLNDWVFRDPAVTVDVIHKNFPESEENRKRFRLACWVARQK